MHKTYIFDDAFQHFLLFFFCACCLLTTLVKDAWSLFEVDTTILVAKKLPM